jgi:glycosyltransferase involved in cell wall biosynthesis
MSHLLYLSLARFPTEKAHGLQIMQNCEAFAAEGYSVELWVSRRLNTPAMQALPDPYAHYGVERTFSIGRVACLDVYALTAGNLFLEKIAFGIFVITYLFFMMLRLLVQRADIYYSRDEYVLLVLSLFVPQAQLAFEIHQFWSGRGSAWLQRQVVRRVGHIIAITPQLAADVIQLHGANPAKLLVAHDGIRAARFTNSPAQSAARQEIGWSASAFIVGFVGRLHMLNMDKGVGTLVAALAQIEHGTLALVGGPDDAAQVLQAQWHAHGLPAERFLYVGQVAPERVPLYLAAFDVCAMPHPFTKQFAYYTSPLKLFEYMAAGRAIVASDLPGWADVLQHEVTALLFPADDVQQLALMLRRLRANPALCATLGNNARQHVMAHYTWAARAKRIRVHLERGTIQ